jgi:hypothetical protein
MDCIALSTFTHTHSVRGYPHSRSRKGDFHGEAAWKAMPNDVSFLATPPLTRQLKNGVSMASRWRVCGTGSSGGEGAS